MGIISPKKPNGVSKVLLTVLLILLSPIFIIAVSLYSLWGAILYLAIWLTGRKQFVVFVYSDSPIWKDYIEIEILPHLQEHAVVLNWSERRRWKNSLAVLAFRHFGGYRNFNPIVMVFHPFHLVKAHRFFEAFQEFKHGNPGKVEQVKKELFDDIRI
jgi:hypothetical protein